MSSDNDENVFKAFFYDHYDLMNDIYGINYVQDYAALSGWTDFTLPFCDSIIIWCIYNMAGVLNTWRSDYMSMIRKALDNNFDVHEFDIKFVRSGKWQAFDDRSWQMDIDKKNMDPAGWISGYIAIKISFHNLMIDNLLAKLNIMLAGLTDVILQSIDITCDCAYISTRSIIEGYLLSHGLVDQSAIVDDQHSVGDNCISFYLPASVLGCKMRVKIYNKFVQVLESANLYESIGSRLSHLVADPVDPTFVDKLKRYLSTGYTRIELSVYESSLRQSALYAKEMDCVKQQLAHCPTFKVPLNQQWHLIVDKLTQVVAVYLEDKQKFAYSHWWNSCTKRIQGCISEEDKSLIPCLLANFGFNDRVIHCFVIKSMGDKYQVVQQTCHKRPDGCRAMTFVPSIRNGLFPTRKGLQRNVQFQEIGLDYYKNVYIEWPDNRLQRTRYESVTTVTSVQMSSPPAASPASDVFEMTSMIDALPSSSGYSSLSLTRIELIVNSMYQPDYTCLTERRQYTVIEYGYGDFRKKPYLYLTLEGGVHVRCGEEMKAAIEPQIDAGVSFSFEVTRNSRVKGVHKVNCRII
jgi:hypothetical protein